MSIDNIKEKIESLYVVSLNIDADFKNHPIRVVQAAKSIQGINIKEPFGALIDFVSEYVSCLER